MKKRSIKRKPEIFFLALVLSLSIPIFGYIYLGWLIALLFLLGYLSGFVFWLFIPTKASYASIKVPFWTTLVAFILLHKVEENAMKFFEVMGEKITGIPVPEVTPLLILSLLILPVGMWLLTPFLIKRGSDFGYYLAWTFFTSIGLIEPAHFIFPFLTNEPYGYFPGMASVIIVAPLAWWGMWRLSRKNT